jgi:alpha-mannosidase
MKYEDLVVLIPSHSLEDFPQEQPEPHGTGLLNAWQILYHPRLIASARTLPRWHRADGPPELCSNRLFVIPTCCRDRVPASWVDSARREGAVIVADRTERADLLHAALEPLGDGPALNPDLVADFLAFGF